MITQADRMTNDQIRDILAAPPRKSDRPACRLFREAEFSAWERTLRAQVADAQGDPSGRLALGLEPRGPEALPALNRLLGRLLDTKARMLR
jgi:hypothetical protein